MRLTVLVVSVMSFLAFRQTGGPEPGTPCDDADGCTINIKINQFAAELVASEVLSMTASSIEAFNNGEGLTVDEVQEIIDNGGVADRDEDEDDEGIRF